VVDDNDGERFFLRDEFEAGVLRGLDERGAYVVGGDGARCESLDTEDILDHIFLSVSNVERSIAFYTAALAPLGIATRLDYDGKNGPPGHLDLNGSAYSFPVPLKTHDESLLSCDVRRRLAASATWKNSMASNDSIALTAPWNKNETLWPNSRPQ
jgi:hypothetical protein